MNEYSLAKVQLLIISIKSLSLFQILTKVESRHDSTNHASMLALAVPRIENNVGFRDG